MMTMARTDIGWRMSASNSKLKTRSLRGVETLWYDDSSTTNGLLVETFVVLTHYELRLIASNLFRWNTSTFFLMVKSVRI